MHVIHETPAATEMRLLGVIRDAEFVVHDRPYVFVSGTGLRFPAELISRAIAFVRDESAWSALVPTVADHPERVVVFSFHFAPEQDNSGFVGWLASHLKSRCETGVMLVCGHDRRRGGIFDYWGVPAAAAQSVIAEIESLRSAAGAAAALAALSTAATA